MLGCANWHLNEDVRCENIVCPTKFCGNTVICPVGLAEAGEEGQWWTKSFLLSILCLRDSCEMKVLIIHGVICIYLNCRNGDKHPLFSTPGLFMRLIIIKWDCVGGRVDKGGRVLKSMYVCVLCIQNHKSPKLISRVCVWNYISLYCLIIAEFHH